MAKSNRTRLHVMFETETYEWLRQAAHMRRISMGSYIREAVKNRIVSELKASGALPKEVTIGSKTDDRP